MARLKEAGLTVEAAHQVARGETRLAPGVFIVITDPAEAVTADG